MLTITNGSLDARLLARFPDGIPHDTMSVRDAKAVVANLRPRFGFKAVDAPLLTKPDDNAKLAKGTWRAYGLCLAPHRVAGVGTTCTDSTPECRAHCLNYAGKGGVPAVGRGRIWKTVLLAEHPEAFATLLHAEVSPLDGDEDTLRLNVFADLLVERLFPWVWDAFDGPIYDYTKRWNRPRTGAYHLTYSATERTTVEQIRAKVGGGDNVAVVVNLRKSQDLPEVWHGMKVIDGDVHDHRFLDPDGVVVMLRAKGSLRKSGSGFAREIDA